MKNCLLCKQRIADKTGSHIVPHFLLKRIENVDGKKGRDHELGFVIRSFDTTSHFGRSVAPEKLNEVFGELTEKDLISNKHPLVVDNFFCNSCESKLSALESEYAKTLEKHDSKMYETGIASGIALLFWSSVIWRVSVNKKSGVTLSKGQDEKLRRILHYSLKDDVSEIDLVELKKFKEAKRISYRLIRCPQYSENNGTHMVWHPRVKHPYSIVIDEFLLFFAFKDNYNDYTRTSFFGMTEEIWDAPINRFDGVERVKPITDERMKLITEGLIDEIKKQRLTNMDLFWDKIHVAIGGRGRRMPDRIKEEILAELTSEEKLMGRKYNLEDLKNSTHKVLSKYLH